MKNRLLLFGLLLVVISFTQCKSGKNQAQCDDGFVQLFNGKNFDGWYLKIRNGNDSLANKVFTVDTAQGWVHVFRDLPDSFELNTGKSYTHGLFYTNNSYQRFIFRFEYKWGKKIMNNFNQFQYDAGLYYHVFDDSIWPKGIEYQVRYDHTTDKNHTGDFWASGTTFQWYSDTTTNTFLHPSEGGYPIEKRGGEHLGSPNIEHNALNDQWNMCEAIVMGNKYAIHKLNGKIVNMATDLSVGEGIIGLQSETAEIFYRNIMIKELDEDIPMEEFLK